MICFPSAQLATIAASKESITQELIKVLPAAIIALVIGLVAAAIAYRQYKVAKAKLNLDLFEKRFPFYEATKSILDAAFTGVEVDLDAYGNMCAQSSFLFGKQVNAYMHLCWMVYMEFRSYVRYFNGETSSFSEKDRPNIRIRKDELEAWIVKQIREPGVENQFRKFLDFSRWN